MDIRRINPAELSQPTGYAHVTVSPAGRQVHVSGQVAKDADGRTVGAGDLRLQTEQVYRNLQVALEAAGAGLGDVVKVVTYVVDLTPEKAATIRTVRSRIFEGFPVPASTMVGIGALVAPDLLIEIEATAAIA